MTRLALALALLAAACGKNEAVRAVEHMADEMCACPDAKCTREVWAKQAAALLDKHKNARGTEEDKQAIDAAGKRMRDCMEKMK